MEDHFSFFWAISVLNDRFNPISILIKFYLPFSVFPFIIKSFYLFIVFRRMLAGEGQVWTRTQTCSPADVIASPCWVSRHCGEENCWSDSREGKHFSVEVERLEGLERELEEGRKWSLGIDRQLIRLEEQESGMGIFF